MSNTQFGYQRVTKDEKEKRVNDVFSSVAPVYDKMNNTMSFGMHHLWKRHALHSLNLYEDSRVMDLACGSGDISELVIPNIPRGELLCVDPNSEMLKICKERLGKHQQVRFIESSAEKLALPIMIDRAIISFGLRNFNDTELGLKQIFDAMAIGSKLVILEFNPPSATSFKNPYDMYLNNIIPFWGRTIGHDEDSYQYLADSISVQPLPDDRIKQIESAGFDFVTHTPLTLGVVGLFEAHKCK